MNPNSKLIYDVEGIESKYHPGDVICYKGDENWKSQHYLVVELFIEKHPFYTQVWYLLVDKRDRACTGLQSVVEESMVKVPEA